MVCTELVGIHPHPHADRLSICDVRTGGDAIVTVVCGATNMRAGDRVAYAPPGSTLPGGKTIGAAEIRGVMSTGMLCTEAELGIGSDSDGILILPNDVAIGERVAAILGLEDTVLDIAITPNRGDCLSVLGIAREIAALTGQRLRRQRVTVREANESAGDLIGIRIMDADLCARYVGRVITDIKIGPSPKWMQNRLRAIGMRPINNVVDVTNYVMIERGQPLHAFDYDRLPHHEIVVRRAGSAASFTTLDGQVHVLQADDLLICSGDEPVAIAGVMGGMNSDVTASTRRILLESAWFAPSSVRRTAKRLGLRTEASYRFERTIDIDGVPIAADRAAALIAKLGGGSVAHGRVDTYPSVRRPAPIALRLKRVDDLLGMTVGRAETIAKLKALGIAVSPATRGTLTAVPPSYRADLTREIDLIEEIARMVGYENVPAAMPECALAGPGEEVNQRRERDLKRFLNALGLTEVVLQSFCSPRLNELFPGLGNHGAAVSILNPVTQDDNELRLSLCSGLMGCVRTNLDQGASSIAAFAMGKVFWRDEAFQESHRLAGVICRNIPSRGLGRRDAVAQFDDVKGIVEAVFEYTRVAATRWVAARDLPAFHPGKTARIEIDTEVVGLVGGLHPNAEESLGITGPCWIFELDLARLLEYCPPRIVFQDLPRFPAVVRDVAVISDEAFASDQIVQFVRQWNATCPLIEDIQLFDQYVGAPIPAGKKGLAYSISYRAPDRTLTDVEVNEMHTQLIAALRDALHVEPR